ncbi:MAG: hypothetical protein KKF46_03420 [Nanoarchaeota archaeon]|nr:hypothetical protein [Nanoarchaeota archaeon]MBU1321384.1 hypothetical protein [Nanoarchaeota archaeon]MBU1597444.1 hypothetical protein [Nanoarchaeota archaeon]MBU2441350.1 hypothetical protein [Nanoarchaeota archaeon]
MRVLKLRKRLSDLFIINLERKAALMLFTLLILFFAFKGMPVTSWGPASNYENYSVKTTVNVTNAYPEILNITCNGDQAITLTAGSTKLVSCLIEILDYNDGDDVNYVNGTFYYNVNESSDPDDNNTHYTNTTCTVNNTNGFYANWTCAFDVWYYALNGTWEMNSTVNDSFGAKDNDYGNATVNTLLALNVTSLIDYEDLAVTETSSAIEANITNFGNVPINVTIYGFGGEDEVAYAGLAMVCDQRNITIDNERYDLSAVTVYDSMTPLTSSAVPFQGIKIQKQTDPDVYQINSTYWRIHINMSTNPFGVCNGTVVFAAESP